MQVKELVALLATLDQEMEVVVQDYGMEYYAGVKDTEVKTVFPWNGEGYSDPEPVFILRQTHETVAADEASEPDEEENNEDQ